MAQQQYLSQSNVTYEKQSSFIKEFKIPVKDRGLKGITTDADDNVWFYHATNNRSTIMKMSREGTNFSRYNISGKTVVDNAVINLAGGQLLFDNTTNAIWFTDARTNSLGRLDMATNKTELYPIPTNNSGVMGLVFSPDRKNLWFTEIIGNKIGSFDIKTKNMIEYPTGNDTGPTLLNFDSKGILWVTLSYSNSILRVEPWLLIPETRVSGMSTISLEKPDFFSPFGIVTTYRKGIESMFISDHGSSRVIVSKIDSMGSNLTNYTSYWTSPSQAIPMTLPSQVAADKAGNVYFAEHGGNKIAKISANNGSMIEFEIPTGPIAASVFISVSHDGKKIWFTEWSSNKVAYLDNSLPLPLTMQVKNNQASPITLKKDQSLRYNVTLNSGTNSSSLLRSNETELSLVGMTDSGLQGVTYTIVPQRFNMLTRHIETAHIELNVLGTGAEPGKYSIMTRVTALDKDGSLVSLLSPILFKLNVPSQMKKTFPNQPSFASDNSSTIIRDVFRYGAILVVIGLIGYLIHRKIKEKRFRRSQKSKL